MTSDLQTSTSAHVAELEVPPTWRLWSGWTTGLVERQKTKEWWQVEDPMDDIDFDEAVAFPTWKPNAEVFQVGVPDYSRTQRGWFHVKSWPPVASTEHETEVVFSTGADISPKLFGFILKHIVQPGPQKTVSKREAGRLSLVCRGWAGILRPRIFESITIRGREDVEALSRFLRDPTSRMATYIRMLMMSQSFTQYPCQPWIHTVSTHCLPKLPNLISRPVTELSGPLQAGRFIKSLSDMLPRSVPWAFSEVTTLHLRDLHFQNVGDLMRVPQELPSLYDMKCKNVTWDRSSNGEVPAVSSYLTRTRSPMLRAVRYTFQGCTDDTAAAWFAVLLALKRRDRLEPGDAHLVCGIASALMRNVASFDRADYAVESWRFEGSLAFGVKQRNVKRWDAMPAVSVHYGQSGVGEALRVQEIKIYFSRASVSNAIESCDWETVNKLMEAFSALESLLIVFHPKDDVLPVHNMIIEKYMSGWTQAERLMYSCSPPTSPFTTLPTTFPHEYTFFPGAGMM
ncbi:hypothetical protein NM688_g4897 [Phlebia brevispora]|uniref:Uncharacterized protein n=1 Tax=Phlebia brevispora TaxID=194682 RepID=A0ACC1T280_9APHY|nr:hypothetical protein NM688_g4897 [Phlebia brevispora]